MVQKRLMTIGVAVAARALVRWPVSVPPGGATGRTPAATIGTRRSQPSETKLNGRQRRSGSRQKWAFTTGGDVSATPAVRRSPSTCPTGPATCTRSTRRPAQQIWKASIAGSERRPVRQGARDADGDREQGDRRHAGQHPGAGRRTGRQGARLRQDHRAARCGAPQADSHPAAIITQSATVFDGRVYVGVASQEEALAALRAGLSCCTFRGSMLALDLEQPARSCGRPTWRRPATRGNAVWGSSPAIDTKRSQVYIATGNNYSVPAVGARLRRRSGGDPAAQAACLAGRRLLRLDHGARPDAPARSGGRPGPFPTMRGPSTASRSSATAISAPTRQGPTTTSVRRPRCSPSRPAGRQAVDLVGAGRRAASTGRSTPTRVRCVWVTQAGRAAPAGGLQWGSAVDGNRVYTANANSNLVPWTLPGGAVTTKWRVERTRRRDRRRCCGRRRPDRHGGGASGPVDDGERRHVRLLARPRRATCTRSTGRPGRCCGSFASGGSCLSGAAISNGTRLLGLGLQQLRLRHTEQQGVRLRSSGAEIAARWSLSAELLCAR